MPRQQPGADQWVAPSSPDSGAPRVILYGRPGCHLCDIAHDQVARVTRATGTTYAVVDLDATDVDPELRARWSDLVPVVTVDGRHHAHWRLDEATLAGALHAGSSPGV